MPRIYLAGPITGCTYGETVDWRQQIIKALPEIQCFSPMRYKSYLESEGVLGKSYEQIPMSSAKGITNRDRFDVMNCHAVFMNLVGATKISAGTMIEVGWADAFRKPIILISEPGNIHDHPMVNEIAAYRVNTLEEGVHLTRALLTTGC